MGIIKNQAEKKKTCILSSENIDGVRTADYPFVKCSVPEDMRLPLPRKSPAGEKEDGGKRPSGTRSSSVSDGCVFAEYFIDFCTGRP